MKHFYMVLCFDDIVLMILISPPWDGIYEEQIVFFHGDLLVYERVYDLGYCIYVMQMIH